MRIEVKCVAVVTQGIDKVLIDTTDALHTPEERMILNLSQARGIMEVGESYEIIINKLPRKKNITAMSP